MKLLDIQGDKALDLWADIIEPVSMILSDDAVKTVFKEESKLKLAQYIISAHAQIQYTYIIKNHKKEIVEIMARLDGKDPANYTVNFFTLPMNVLEILNDPGIIDLFTSQGQNEE